MADSFNFGAPAKRGPQVQLSPRLLVAVAGLIVAFLLVSFVMRFFSSSGKQIAKDQVSVVASADAARDAEAKSALTGALQNAKLAFVDGGDNYTSAGPGQLSALDPSFTYTDGPSTSPTIVSVVNTDSAWSAAVMSASGTCFWVHDDPAKGGTTYGEGTPCTGAAAASATGSSW